MAGPNSTVYENARISPEDVKTRLEDLEALTVLDVRGERSWESSGEKIRGAVRLSPENFHVDPSLPRDWLTVAYCT